MSVAAPRRCTRSTSSRVCHTDAHGPPGTFTRGLHKYQTAAGRQCGEATTTTTPSQQTGCVRVVTPHFLNSYLFSKRQNIRLIFNKGQNINAYLCQNFHRLLYENAFLLLSFYTALLFHMQDFTHFSLRPQHWAPRPHADREDISGLA